MFEKLNWLNGLANNIFHIFRYELAGVSFILYGHILLNVQIEFS